MFVLIRRDDDDDVSACVSTLNDAVSIIGGGGGHTRIYTLCNNNTLLLLLFGTVFLILFSGVYLPTIMYYDIAYGCPCFVGAFSRRTPGFLGRPCATTMRASTEKRMRYPSGLYGHTTTIIIIQNMIPVLVPIIKRIMGRIYLRVINSGGHRGLGPPILCRHKKKKTHVLQYVLTNGMFILVTVENIPRRRN